MHKHGTKIEASSDAGHLVRGYLVGDYGCLDEVLTVYDEDEGDEVTINGWLWSIDVIETA